VSDVTRVLDRVQQGEPKAAEELLPLVYEELRKLATHKMALEPPGHTLQPTALVHEAWLRLVGTSDPHWHGRGHFFGAAAEAMRRILIERARRRERQRHGGQLERVDLDAVEIAAPLPDSDLLALDEALDRLAVLDPPAAELVKLRFFAGVAHAEAAKILRMSRSGADRTWVFARAWLLQQIKAGETPVLPATGDPGQGGEILRPGSAPEVRDSKSRRILKQSVSKRRTDG
jgi:RNA polymerase sigma factor (TIGR02999 family)